MGKIVLMTDTLFGLDSFQGAQLGEDQFQESGLVEKVES